MLRKLLSKRFIAKLGFDTAEDGLSKVRRRSVSEKADNTRERENVNPLGGPHFIILRYPLPQALLPTPPGSSKQSCRRLDLVYEIPYILHHFSDFCTDIPLCPLHCGSSVLLTLNLMRSHSFSKTLGM